jgi:ADP-ribose pyrophosphatase YjhB (NUDIX family)
MEAIHRELKEELNLVVENLRFVAVDYVSNHDVRGEYLQMMFTADELSEKQIALLKTQITDIKNFKFVDIETALQTLAPHVAYRLKSSELGYLENGRSVYSSLK